MSRVLIVKTSSMGDLVHALPAVTDLMRALPSTHVGWLAEEGFSDIAGLHPAVKTVHRCAVRRWRRSPLASSTRSEWRSLRSELLDAGYEQVVDLQGLLKSAVLSRLSSAPVAGFDRHSAREPLASLTYRSQFAVAMNLHAVERNRQLLAQALGYSITAPSDYGLGPTLRSESRRVLCLHGTSKDSKCWPLEHWVRLAEAFAVDGLQCLWPSGSAAESARAAQLARVNGKALPRMGLADLAAQARSCQFAIGVDTGLTHLAAALGLPTVGLYLDTQPGLTGVYPGVAPVVNLGARGACPSVEDVLNVVRLWR